MEVRLREVCGRQAHLKQPRVQPLGSRDGSRTRLVSAAAV